MAALRPGFGPSLPELLAPRVRSTPQRVRLVVLALAAVLLVVQLGRVVVARTTSDLSNTVVVREPVAFNLAWRDGLRRADPAPAGLALELATAPGDPAPQRLTVTTEPFSAGAADPSAVLAERAGREIPALREQYGETLRYRGDARTRINLLPAHQVLFQAQVDGRTTYGKRFLIVAEEKPTQLAVVTLTSARSAAIPSVDEVGNLGALKAPLRSFRFGTERP